jgi:hypothetical protein
LEFEMSTALVPKMIQKIAVVDDDEQARAAMAETIVDANLQPIVQRARLNSLNDLIIILKRDADAAVCDHRLKPRNYAAFQGAEAVSELYKIGFPAILVTAWSTEDVDNIRPYRRRIPIVIRSGDLEPKAIKNGITLCLNEFQNTYVKERYPWRVIIRIEEVDKSSAFVIIPSWDPKIGLRLPLSIFTSECGQIRPGIRLFAEVNIGASKAEDLYFDRFEVAEKPR